MKRRWGCCSLLAAGRRQHCSSPLPRRLSNATLEQSETSIGFQRPMEEPLQGSLEPYERHLFVATQQDATAWPARVDTMEGSLPALLQKFFKGQEHPKIKGTKLAAIEHAQHIGPEGMLVFPEAIHIPSVQATDFPALSQMLTQPNTAASVEYAMKHLRATRLDRHVDCHIFICCHLQRDQRCGYCGPLLVDAFEKEAAIMNVSNRVRIYKTSHIGGHKFAGNVITFPSGDWYGYITPSRVREILEAHLNDSNVARQSLEPCLRGTMAQ